MQNHKESMLLWKIRVFLCHSSVLRYSSVEANKSGRGRQTEVGTKAAGSSSGYLGLGNWVARLLEIFQLSKRLKAKERGNWGGGGCKKSQKELHFGDEV
jgi:hypothetical protein